MSSEIDLQDLKKVIDLIISRLIEKHNIKQISLSEKQDFYWEVPTDKLYKIDEDQPQLDIGRLSDDWDLLQSILENPEHAVSLELIHVAPLLRWIGEKVGQ